VSEVIETSMFLPAYGGGSVPLGGGDPHCVASALPVTPNPQEDEQMCCPWS
jgi:hypothetical protein